MKHKSILDGFSSNSSTFFVITSILKNKDRILILERSDKVKSMKKKWAAISGYLETNEDMLSRALLEIHEETRIEKEMLILKKIFNFLYVDINYTNLIIQPFCFQSDTLKVTLDWEHSRYKWIKEEEINNYSFVPKLKDILKVCFII